MVGSKMSEIFDSYSKTLKKTKEFHNKLQENYEKFIKTNADKLEILLVKYGKLFKNDFFRHNLIKYIEEFFGSKRIPVIAIDGTAGKECKEDYIVFYSLAQGVEGEIIVNSDSINFRKITDRQQNRIPSIVAYIPIPFSELTLYEETSLDDLYYLMSSDDDKVDLNSLNLEIMKLCEIYLAYSSIQSNKIILIDNSFSSLLMHSEVKWENIGLINGKFGASLGLEITPAHVAITKAHPFYPDNYYKDSNIKLPTLSKFRLFSRLISDLVYLFDEDRTFITWDELKETDRELDINSLKENLNRQSNLVSKLIHWDEKGIYVGGKKEDDEGFKRISWFKQLWEETTIFYKLFCSELFEEHNTEVLMYRKVYEINGNNNEVKSWITPNDIKFLIEVGIKTLVEKAYRNRVMLIGVIKDSAGRYLIKNVLSTLNYIGKSPFEKEITEELLKLQPTDRRFLELMVKIKDDLNSPPISTIEFDSVFNLLKVRCLEFKLLGVAQGRTVDEYVECYQGLLDFGYRYIAIGGLLKRNGNSNYVRVHSEDFLKNVVKIIQEEFKPKYLFTLGVYNPKRHKLLERLGIWGADYKGWLFSYDEFYRNSIKYLEKTGKINKNIKNAYKDFLRYKLNYLDKKTPNLKRKFWESRKKLDEELRKNGLSLQELRYREIRESLEKNIVSQMIY